MRVRREVKKNKSLEAKENSAEQEQEKVQATLGFHPRHLRPTRSPPHPAPATQSQVQLHLSAPVPQTRREEAQHRQAPAVHDNPDAPLTYVPHCLVRLVQWPTLECQRPAICNASTTRSFADASINSIKIGAKAGTNAGTKTRQLIFAGARASAKGGSLASKAGTGRPLRLAEHESSFHAGSSEGWNGDCCPASLHSGSMKEDERSKKKAPASRGAARCCAQGRGEGKGGRRG